MTAKYWQSAPPSNCSHCGNAITNVFSDMQTRRGPWAYLCDPCVSNIGVGSYGVGLGQRYQRQPDGRWLKTNG